MRRDTHPTTLARQCLRLLGGLVLAGLILVGLQACDLVIREPDRVAPVVPVSPTATPQPVPTGTDADLDLIEQAADNLRNLTRYHYEVSGPLGTIEGDVARGEGASMVGHFGKTPVAILLRNGQYYQQEGNRWITKPMTDALAPFMGGFVSTSTVQMASAQLQDPVNVGLLYTFPLLTLHHYHSPHNMNIIGEENMHETRVTHYKFPACENCFGAMPRYYMASAWIDPVTRQVHRYTRGDWNIPNTITISRHNDPSLQLPAP